MLDTPYYLIDERKLLVNLKKIRRVRDLSGARSLLALKCFATWAVFPLMSKWMDGTTSSSLNEARLGYERFGGETHAYSVAFPESEVKACAKFADKIIFNSISQLERYYPIVKHLKIGLRANPGYSYSHFDLADPARRNSRLGVKGLTALKKAAGKISGLMFHLNCENDSFPAFRKLLDRIVREYGPALKRLEWVSLGGGLYFTKEGYPLEAFASLLKEFSERFGVQVYLEPGEAAITRSAELVSRVLDVVENEGRIAIVDASVEPHMLDLLIYRTPAKMDLPKGGRHRFTVAGRSCLAGDVFGTWHFPKPLRPGDTVRFADAAGYTMVKKNWFNGIPMPSIVVRRLDGRLEIVRKFGYNDFATNLTQGGRRT